jgi:heme exporter protein C
LFQIANPRRFMNVSKVLFKAGLLFMILGLSLGYALVWFLPDDAVQGPIFKILYVHVPAAWFSMGLYAGLAVMSLSYLVWKHMVSFFVAEACAWVGAVLTLICLVTGMLWGKPTWGTWWVWDARLTSVLVLFFLYIGYLVLIRSFDHWGQAAHNSSLLAVFGAVNLPIIKWSVTWWHTLHQPASVTKFSAPSLAGEFLWPLLLCAFGWFGYVVVCVCWITWTRIKCHQLLAKGMRDAC